MQILAENECVLDGQCGTIHTALLGHLPIPCYKKHSPAEIKDSSILEDFKILCPSFFKNSINQFCCNVGQIEAMQRSMDNAKALLSKCPSCHYNWKEIFCQLSCSPNQANFLQVTETADYRDNATQTIEKQVLTANYYISDNFTQSTFDSCKNVAGPTGKALSLMCGTNDCTRDIWFNFMGKAIRLGGFSPFQLNFQHTNKTEIVQDQQTYLPMNVTTIPCHMSIGSEFQACSCSDCPATCLNDKLPKWARTLPPPPKNWMILGRPGGLVIAWIFFILSIVMTIGYYIGIILKRNKSFSRKC